ncbi:Fic family protein [Arachidicoccus soli]|uniref:Fic family protein n=1 Tax=Arachidicoccus soli TaxID=2341117 RepID=A0A386HSG6_9BACT|nr:Fic family protein [Arachidicoccus soli]AYD48897.1 Fic family protein [Arachidicoccus soli]
MQTISVLLSEIDSLKAELQQYRHLESEKVAKAFELEYTYESNRIEGNTLTLQETALVVEKGLTIGGKSMQEHLEAINHSFAIDFVKELVKSKTPFTETVLLDIHNLILKSINNENAGKYRNVQVLIGGAKHVPPQPYLVPKQMEDMFIWYNENKGKLHPILLAGELHERMVTIHPFIDGNGRTSRLLMNLVLLQNGFPIAILKGDTDSRLQYYSALETAQMENNKQPFLILIADNVKATLERLLRTLK